MIYQMKVGFLLLNLGIKGFPKKGLGVLCPSPAHSETLRD